MGRDMTVAKNCRPDTTGFSASSRSSGSDETLPVSIDNIMDKTASLPTEEIWAGEASDFRSSRPAASNARSERPE
eukprot:15099358-Heterocapsa_arctica.AAC.1